MKNILRTAALFLILTSCASPTSKTTEQKNASGTVAQNDLMSNEGFYHLNEFPPALKSYFPRNILDTIKLSTGVIMAPVPEKMQKPGDYKTAFDDNCTDPDQRMWMSQTCDDWDECKHNRAKSCQPKGMKGMVCAAALFTYNKKQYALTSHHCLFHPLAQKQNLSVRFWHDPMSADTIDLPIKLVSTDIKEHPYGIVVYEIEGWPWERPTGKISSRDLQKHEPVIQAGFPRPSARKVFNGSYAQTASGLRVSIGKIVEENKEGKSFCQFTPNMGLSDQESWTLESTCPGHDVLLKNEKFAAILKTPEAWTFPREEKDPFLTNTDMINGMSGGPLFDHKGEIIGIGSTVLKNGPPLDYDPKYRASFSKARNVYKFLK